MYFFTLTIAIFNSIPPPPCYCNLKPWRPSHFVLTGIKKNTHTHTYTQNPSEKTFQINHKSYATECRVRLVVNTLLCFEVSGCFSFCLCSQIKLIVLGLAKNDVVFEYLTLMSTCLSCCSLPSPFLSAKHTHTPETCRHNATWRFLNFTSKFSLPQPTSLNVAKQTTTWADTNLSRRCFAQPVPNPRAEQHD